MIGAISAPSVSACDCNAQISPIKSHTFGHSYREWAAKWWQWALGTPARINPLFDATGEFCDAGQKGPVWFLASTLGYSGGEYGPVERDCTVPFGKSLFFPIINAGYFAFLNDDPEYRTEEFVRSMVDCTTPSLLNVTIDGVPVKKPYRYFEESPLFDVQLPEENIFGARPYPDTEPDPDTGPHWTYIPELLLSPSVDEGYYLFVWPLSPGAHKIHWKTAWSCPFGDFSEDITYNLDVKKKWR